MDLIGQGEKQETERNIRKKTHSQLKNGVIFFREIAWRLPKTYLSHI